MTEGTPLSYGAETPYADIFEMYGPGGELLARAVYPWTPEQIEQQRAFDADVEFVTSHIRKRLLARLSIVKSSKQSS